MGSPTDARCSCREGKRGDGGVEKRPREGLKVGFLLTLLFSNSRIVRLMLYITCMQA